MSKKIIFVLLGLAILGISLLLGFNSTGLFTLSESKINIGAILPLTGNYGYQGQDIKEGIELALDEINNDKNNSYKFTILYEDVGTNFKEGAITSYQKLTNINNVKLLITSYGDTVLAIAPLAEKDKVIAFAVASGSPKISQAGDYIFRNNLLPEDEFKILSKYIYEDKNILNFVTVGMNTESSMTYTNGFKNEYIKLGGKIEYSEKINRDQTDFKTIITKLKSNNIGAMLLMMGGDQMALFMNECSKQDYHPQIYGGYYTENTKLIEIGKENIEGIIYTNYFDPNFKESKEFIDKFQKKYNKYPNPYSALAYDNIYMLKVSIEKCANVIDTNCIKNNLYKIKDFNGASGTTTINSNGDTIKSIIIKTIKDGEFVKVEN